MNSRSVRRPLAVLGVVLAPLVLASAAGAQQPAPAPQTLGPAQDDHADPPPAPVLPSAVTTTPRPLPTRTGTVRRTPRTLALPLQKTRSLATDDARTAAAAPGQTVELRALVVSLGPADAGRATWTRMLDRVGAAYDVLDVATEPLTADRLVGVDGAGRYNAVLLTDGMLLQQVDGAWVSGLDATEWNLLWDYERTFGVRQATLYASYGTWPEDYCLRPRSEGGVGETALAATLTSAGASALGDLRAGAQIPLRQSWVYRDTLATGCAATPVLTAGTDVLGVLAPTADGRERMALTFTSNEHLLQADLLTYPMFRWASRGLFLGEQRHYLKVDVDDWFNSADIRLPDGTMSPTPYQMRATDAFNALVTQTELLRTRRPLARDFRLTLAYNGEGVDPATPSYCLPTGGVNRLVGSSKCLRNQAEWINHTLTHAEMNATTYDQSRTEIEDNLSMATAFGLAVDRTVLKTGEYSGLGVYNPDPDNDTDPPTDFGLGASNAAFLAAAKDAGVKYLHGNFSFASQTPECFNCAVTHPMEPALSVIPDWPTNIAYFSSTPAQQTSFYNSYYGPDGRFPYFATNQTYAQIVDHESEVALRHLTSGSMATHTLHIANLKSYSWGRTLTFDWLDALAAKYSRYYTVPLLTPSWGELAEHAVEQQQHVATKDVVRAVHDRAAGTVTLSTPQAGLVRLSGAASPGATTYGTTVTGDITLGAGATVSYPARPLP